MVTTALDVLIIGAGSTGLLLAQGLKQQGVQASVFEREDATTYEKRPREWGMTLHWGAHHIAKCVPPEMLKDLNSGICCDPFHGSKDLSLPHYNAQTGEKLFDMPGDQPRRISRRKLRNYLSQGIDVHYGKKLIAVALSPDGRVTATFTDGTSATGALLVGCDGAKSAVRPFLVGEEAAKNEDLDIQMLNTSCAFPKEVALLQRFGHPVFKNSYHPDGFMWWQSAQDIQDPDKPETWLFQNILSWVGAPREAELPDDESRWKFWKEKSLSFADPWKTVGQNFPNGLPLRIDKTTVWRPIDWSSSELYGKVTLAGDAAHCMPAHRGQGLNNALEDAAKLVDELAAAAAAGKQSLLEAVKLYEANMRQRVDVEIPISIAQATMVHSYDTLMQAPFFKHGMNKYREDLAAQGKEVEVATQAKEI